MSRIRGKDTQPELVVRKFLFSHRFRYRLHDKRLPGTPDLVFPKYKTVLFIHGCFWHGHTGCRYFVVPKTRTDWWVKKINTNSSNDEKNILRLQQEGWEVIVVWECSLKKELIESTLKNLISAIKKSHA